MNAHDEVSPRRRRVRLALHGLVKPFDRRLPMVISGIFRSISTTVPTGITEFVAKKTPFSDKLSDSPQLLQDHRFPDGDESS